MSAFSTFERVILNALRSCLRECGRPTCLVRAFHLPALAAVLFSAFTAARAETQLNVPVAPDSDVSIRFSAPWSQVPRFGFAPVRVMIENRARDERTWHVHFNIGMPNQFP